jgi:hypothetical protein
LFGLTTTKPPPSRFSLQSTVAPRSFSTLSSATTMGRSPSCCTVSLARTLAAGSSDSALTYSPSAVPVIRTDSTRPLGSGSAARKSRTRWSADAVIASKAEAGSGTDLR